MRIAKPPDERRSELIACAQKLFYLKGYESTSVRDIVEEVGVAKGTFYYYFDSKLAILEALVDELIGQSVAILHEIVADDTLPALEKWVQAMQVVGAWKAARKTEMLAILQVMKKDENVLLEYKVQKETVRRTAPEFARIIAQGVEEGVFVTEFADESAEIALSIMQSLGDPMINILLHPDQYENPAALASHKVTAAQTAIELVLGAPRGSLPLADLDTLETWFVR